MWRDSPTHGVYMKRFLLLATAVCMVGCDTGPPPDDPGGAEVELAELAELEVDESVDAEPIVGESVIDSVEFSWRPDAVTSAELVADFVAVDAVPDPASFAYSRSELAASDGPPWSPHMGYATGESCGELLAMLSEPGHVQLE